MEICQFVSDLNVTMSQNSLPHALVQLLGSLSSEGWTLEKWETRGEQDIVTVTLHWKTGPRLCITAHCCLDTDTKVILQVVITCTVMYVQLIQRSQYFVLYIYKLLHHNYIINYLLLTHNTYC